MYLKLQTLPNIDHIIVHKSNLVCYKKTEWFHRGKADHILSLACFCHIPTAGSFAGLQIPNLDISSGLQMSVRTVQLSLSQIPTAAALLESKPVHMKTLVLNCQLTCPMQFSVMRSCSVSLPFTMALFKSTNTLNGACLTLQLYF